MANIEGTFAQDCAKVQQLSWTFALCLSVRFSNDDRVDDRADLQRQQKESVWSLVLRHLFEERSSSPWSVQFCRRCAGTWGIDFESFCSIQYSTRDSGSFGSNLTRGTIFPRACTWADKSLPWQGMFCKVSVTRHCFPANPLTWRAILFSAVTTSLTPVHSSSAWPMPSPEVPTTPSATPTGRSGSAALGGWCFPVLSFLLVCFLCVFIPDWVRRPPDGGNSIGFCYDQLHAFGVCRVLTFSGPYHRLRLLKRTR